MHLLTRDNESLEASKPIEVRCVHFAYREERDQGWQRAFFASHTVHLLCMGARSEPGGSSLSCTPVAKYVGGQICPANLQPSVWMVMYVLQTYSQVCGWPCMPCRPAVKYMGGQLMSCRPALKCLVVLVEYVLQACSRSSQHTMQTLFHSA
eukprot:scaffold199588_cov17-Tisochrysis_lutea.AAC.1